MEPEEPELKKRLTPSVKIQSWLESTKLLKNDHRKSVLGKHPIQLAIKPKLDEAVAALVPKTAKSQHKLLNRLQNTLDAMGPTIWLLDQVDKGKVIDPKAGKGAIKGSISLLSNASAHFNLERRKALMKHLNRDLQPLAEGEFPDRGVYLFGEDSSKQTKSRSDNIKALKGVQPKRQGLFSGSGGPNRPSLRVAAQFGAISWQPAGQCSRDWTLPQCPKTTTQQKNRQPSKEPSKIMPSPPWLDAVTPPANSSMLIRAISQDLGFITPAPMGIPAGRTALNLGKNHIRSLDVGGREWVSVGAHKFPFPQFYANCCHPAGYGIEDLRRDQGHSSKDAQLPTFTHKGFSPLVPQKGWRFQAGDQPAPTEPVHKIPTLQNGRYACSTGSAPIRRLNVQNRSQGRIFQHPGTSKRQEVPTVCLEKAALLPAFWPFVTPLGIHQDTPTQSWGSSELRASGE